ncbi:hypothetical protein D7V80_17525 [Corallococcus sp. CA054B]|uniref:hypothetical protein n=1 Tax=Corallococcus sp. CA054B TaxID=2316734 RepID=UPI000EA302E7|nr:hypothetical protein [Corallococcus sp. CA054B]RKG67083.1 hypothetical protein D7V80_17525 [Corallococcus sp. CA054B]
MRRDPSGGNGQGLSVDNFDPNRVAMVSSGGSATVRMASQPALGMVEPRLRAANDPSGPGRGKIVVDLIGVTVMLLLRALLGQLLGKPASPPPPPSP